MRRGRTINDTPAYLPTESDIRREKRKLREKHLAKLRPMHQPNKRPPNIREYPASLFFPGWADDMNQSGGPQHRKES